MKNFFLVGIFLIFQSQASHADLTQDLRQLRNTISETSKASKELSDLTGSNKEIKATQPTAKPNVAELSVSEGDLLIGKIDNIRLYELADKRSNVITKLSKHDELIYTGHESNGLYSVNANGNEGWVEKILVKRR